MPVEIRELIIRAAVNETKSLGSQHESSAGMSRKEKEALVQQCVSQVLQCLKDKAER